LYLQYMVAAVLVWK